MNGGNGRAEGNGGNRGSGDDEFDPAAALHDHLVATEERPVEREAGWYLGEAQALADDIASGDLEPETAVERAGEVRELLDAFETTGDPAADDHVDAARELAARLER